MTAICNICQEKLASGRAFVLSLCGHVCCEDCLVQWVHRNHPPTRFECPMCRKKHSYPKNTIKLFFEEEKTEAETLRAEIRSVMKLVESCAEEPNEASLSKVLRELKSVSQNTKKLKEPQATASMINGLDAMVSHLSKKLAPVQSADQLNEELEAAREASNRLGQENGRLSYQCANLEARIAAYVEQVNVSARNAAELANNREALTRDNSRLNEQVQRQRNKIASLQRELSHCQTSKESIGEKMVALKRKYKNLSNANEDLRLKYNRTLSEANRRSVASPVPRLSHRKSVISIRSDSRPGTPATVLDSDEDKKPQIPPEDPEKSESSDVEFIYDSDSPMKDPKPNFHELKAVKRPMPFLPLAQSSVSKPSTTPTVQKRRLAVPSSSGVELRSGKTTSLLALGPKRSRRSH